MSQGPAPIALTCGEPAGVGVEIAAKLWHRRAECPPFFLIGDPRHLPAGTPHRVIAHPTEAAAALPHGLPVLDHPFDGARVPGLPQPAHAAQIIAVIARAVALTQSGAASALCTLPIHKKALKDGAGFAFPGHTEYLAHLAGQRDVVMMLACADLRVVPTTIHIPLAEVPRALTPELLTTTITLTHAALIRDFGISAPRLAIAGLNPHAGEGGAIGTEELSFIVPLIAKLAATGMNITGPLPADTMFHPAARARYDAAICMYHDQALIPIKTIDFAGGVNVTLGLPFRRTSPDHGTAFDIAGTGRADETSTLNALQMAAQMSAYRA
ncbi:MAG TPA: 4-hydroxythreonine-4-phosphate dehydrogenase PdxA [Rhodobacteraceae bacterium]|jgi:4-hydroxythreonine-4-phosphate dehydrogenase|nr:4-hydroxythreonine-4-phosphate dehydrogenase PdxA [Paracoccaceae bacterium]HBV53674.1 4-hydroxythreonine-4-phosphate dehydrogenase PdxA [Paracoccaceae bacterium]